MKRRRATRRTLVLALTLGSAVAHAALVAVVDVRGAGGGAGRAAMAAEDAAWAFTCGADAELALALRVAGCATPFGGDLDACVRDAVVRLDAERAQCDRADDVEVAFVDVDALDLLPVPLMPEVAPTPDAAAARLIEEEVAAKLEEAAKPLATPSASGQIIEITPPAVEVPPDNARYLSEYDSRVERQTVARGSTEEMVARPSPAEARATAQPPSSPSPPAAGAPGAAGQPGAANPARSMLAMREERPGPEATRTATPGLPADRRGVEQLALDGLDPRRGPTGEPVPPAGQRGGGPEGAEGEGGESPAVALRPSAEVLERAVGGGSVDRIDDAETGDFTALNSRKWKFAGFFNRMKRQVAQNWHPDDVYLRRDPSGNVYGTKDRVTVLQVSLTPTGALSKVFVAQQSGVDFLDDEAIRAFHEAQPFPNPPAALVDAQSKLITFSFGFHFQIGADRSSWRVYRAN